MIQTCDIVVGFKQGEQYSAFTTTQIQYTFGRRSQELQQSRHLRARMLRIMRILIITEKMVGQCVSHICIILAERG